MNMSIAPKFKLKVALEGLEGNTKLTLLSFFYNSTLSSIAEVEGGSLSADLLIVGNEAAVSDDLLKELASNNRYAIVVRESSGGGVLDNDRLIELIEPVKIGDLKNTITLIKERMEASNLCGTNSRLLAENISLRSVLQDTKGSYAMSSHSLVSSDKETLTDEVRQYDLACEALGLNKQRNNLDSPDALRETFFTPGKYLYHSLVKVIDLANVEKSDMQLKTSRGKILYDYSNQTFHYNISEKSLKELYSTPIFNRLSKSSITIETHLDAIDMHITKNATSMVWEGAIYASGGRVPEETDLNGAIEMIFRPNFSKLKTFRYAVQMSAAWSRKSMSLIDTASQLKIPLNYVLTLYSGMYAIGSVSITKTESNHKSITRNKGGSSVFSKMLSHMFLK